MDSAGVTSFIRAVVFEPALYTRLLHFFSYSHSLNLELLTQIWVGLAHQLFSLLRVDPYVVYVSDGLKVAKEGKKIRLHALFDHARYTNAG